MKKVGVLLILFVVLLPIAIAKTIEIPKVTEATTKEINYIYGAGLIAKVEDEEISYYHSDYLSSNRIITDGNKDVTYEKIKLITPEKRSELISDLISRTGLDILKIEIIKINFLNDTATIRLFYKNNNY